jgi:hypothetical protein
MSYSGLGLTQSGTNPILARGADVVALQRRLIAQSALPASVTDGVVSSATSPTIRAVQASAGAAGFPAASVTRTPDGGLQLPTALYQAIMGSDDVIAEAASSGDSWVSNIVKQITGPKTTTGPTSSGPDSRLFIWVATGTALALVGSIALFSSRRARARTALGLAKTQPAIAKNRRRRRS